MPRIPLLLLACSISCVVSPSLCPIWIALLLQYFLICQRSFTVFSVNLIKSINNISDIALNHLFLLSQKFCNWHILTEVRMYSIKSQVILYSWSWGIPFKFRYIECDFTHGSLHFKCSDTPSFDQSLINTHILLFCKATIILWHHCPSDFFMTEMCLEWVLLQLLVYDAR